MNEPELFSIFPVGGRRGATCDAEVLGRNLDGAYDLWFDAPGLGGQIKTVEAIRLEDPNTNESESGKHQRTHRVHLQIEVQPSAQLGTYALRLVTPRGISNAICFLVNSEPVIGETQNPHHTPDQAQALTFPVVVNGRISKAGEVDYFSFQAREREELTFEVFSKPPVSSLANQGGFDSQLALYAPGGSWFDSNQVIRLAFNDEPVSIEYQQNDEDIVTNPKLTYRFAKEGRYLVQVASFLGKGGPDCSYQLRIASADRARLQESEKTLVLLSHSAWQERVYNRKLELNRLDRLWSRGVGPSGEKEATTATSHFVNLLVNERPGSSREHRDRNSAALAQLPTVLKEHGPKGDLGAMPEVQVPTLIEGTIQSPGDVDTFGLQVQEGQALVFELETPEAAPPLFNPWLTVLNEEGHEVFTNIYKRIGRAYTFYQKTVEPKTVFTFERGGKYTLQIRDITSRKGNPTFSYRLLIRPQVPHVGDIQVCRECRRTVGNVAEKTPIDRINVRAGEAKKLKFIADLEEGFAGSLVINVEGLPEGMEALPTTEIEPEKETAIDEGEKERFVPRNSMTTVMLLARANAPPTVTPQLIRIIGRPVIAGKPGSPLQVGNMLLMVVGSGN